MKETDMHDCRRGQILYRGLIKLLNMRRMSIEFKLSCSSFDMAYLTWAEENESTEKMYIQNFAALAICHYAWD